jgi:hypothetical protein
VFDFAFLTICMTGDRRQTEEVKGASSSAD